MIAVDTSVIVATSLGEPEAERFHALVSREDVVIGWPTLLEARMVLTGKNFPNAAIIISQLVALPNVIAVAFGERHHYVAEKAFDLFGKGRHPASLNIGDCYSYAVAAIAKAPLLFKGNDFGRTDVKCHPASATQ
ncbi:ribonuclease VapC [Rhizobium sp. ERR 922]|uniref:type II toxin-antitoxin system VapC family toxin n=1 Tax=Rhizobium TaxID=379 RepID=UPI000DDD5770|nr:MULTISPECIES: type II toxin-antitoxin system VapC family toxin [Rhizobium]MCZ3378380.1 type II toxin-antitoxin system VapC family toxin [Rhizobium sp. AG207R]TWB47506.1 ribonuclease VapC [Rhizobium sp. ERR 922]TWB90864.1 ribonuclease VapC [Rhizobium sp. ERR 942]